MDPVLSFPDFILLVLFEAGIIWLIWKWMHR